MSPTLRWEAEKTLDSEVDIGLIYGVVYKYTNDQRPAFDKATTQLSECLRVTD